MDIRVEDAGPGTLDNLREFTVQADPRWIETIAPFIDAEFRLLTCHLGKETVAYFPHWVRRRYFVQTIITPYPFYYTPLILRVPAHKRHQDAARTELTVVRALATELKKRYPKQLYRLLWDITDCRGFAWEGYRLIPRYTLINRADDISVESLTPAHQTEYRKAERAGLVCRESRDADVMSELMRRSFERQNKRLPLPFERLQAMTRAALTHPSMRLYLTYDHETPVAGGMLQVDPYYDTAFAWMSGFDASHRNGGGVFCWVKEIEALRELCKMVDMCGANTPTIAQFKAGFGGILTPFFHVKYPRLAWR